MLGGCGWGFGLKVVLMVVTVRDPEQPSLGRYGPSSAYGTEWSDDPSRHRRTGHDPDERLPLERRCGRVRQTYGSPLKRVQHHFSSCGGTCNNHRGAFERPVAGFERPVAGFERPAGGLGASQARSSALQSRSSALQARRCHPGTQRRPSRRPADKPICATLQRAALTKHRAA
jgi:hypothetical protein